MTWPHDDAEPARPKVLVIVGEAPSRTSNPAMPLSAPATRSKLEWLFGAEAYRRALKYNLLGAWPGKGDGKGDLFDHELAKTAADALRQSFVLLRGVEFRIVLLGRRVSEAFARGHQLTPLCGEWLHSNSTVTLLPHPTGINRWWNEASNRNKAVRYCRWLARETK